MKGILLGIGLFFQSVSAEESLGQFISYEIEDYGEYEDSQTDLTYVFTKGIFFLFRQYRKYGLDAAKQRGIYLYRHRRIFPYRGIRRL